jgi:polysaccharide export outer membrane protein
MRLLNMKETAKRYFQWMMPAFAWTALVSLLLTGCGGGGSGTMLADASTGQEEAGDEYVIGPGDGLQVFVWGHDDLSTGVQVRPDGEISTPLVEDLVAAGRTPTELARAVEEALAEYVRNPTVTIIVQNFVGEYARQIRVVGQAAEPQALSYRNGMTLLDVMIEVGGLSEFASGNKAKIVRRQNGDEAVIRVRINDLLNKGDMDENVRMMPGDVLIIPESIF